MKKVIFVILGIALLAMIIILLKNDLYSIETSNKSTEVTSTTSARVLNIPEPLTLASLEARDDWNPTMEVEGIARVGDGIPDLQVQEFPTYTEENSGFVLKYLEPVHDPKFCGKYDLEITGHVNYGDYRCLEASSELFNELIILSKDTGEVLHKYRLKESYSFANAKRFYLGSGVSIEMNRINNEPVLSFYISKWDDFTTQLEASSQLKYLNLNLLTGEITEVERQ